MVHKSLLFLPEMVFGLCRTSVQSKSRVVEEGEPLDCDYNLQYYGENSMRLSATCRIRRRVVWDAPCGTVAQAPVLESLTQ